jgi:hypothetical protein
MPTNQVSHARARSGRTTQGQVSPTIVSNACPTGPDSVARRVRAPRCPGSGPRSADDFRHGRLLNGGMRSLRTHSRPECTPAGPRHSRFDHQNGTAGLIPSRAGYLLASWYVIAYRGQTGGSDTRFGQVLGIQMLARTESAWSMSRRSDRACDPRQEGSAPGKY